MKHLLACLVLLAILIAILGAKISELEAGGLKDLFEATAPKGAGVGVHSVVSGLADKAEGGEAFVGFEVGGDALVELCKEYQYVREAFGAIAKGENFTSIGMASKPFQAMLSVVEVVFCGDGM